MGALAEWEPPPDEALSYARLIDILDDTYPNTWRSWEVNSVEYHDLFGDKISADEECRLRFCVPTTELACAFSQETPSSLSERKYKAIKRKLIDWPIGRALIYSLFSTMKMVHPTDAFNGFIQFLPKLKPQLVSRIE